MITKIIKKDGTIEGLDQDKELAFCGGSNYASTEEIGRKLVEILQSNFLDKHPDVGHAKTEEAYKLYTQRSESILEIDTNIGSWARKHSFL